MPAAFPGFMHSGQTCYFRDRPVLCVGRYPRAAWQGLDGTALASSDPENFGDCAGQVFEVINGTPHEPPYPYIYIQVQNNAPTRPEIPTFTGRNFVEIEVTPPAGGSVVN
ncbi:MAG: hypothetical protein JJU27_06460 [Gammaproteobacteria bacterium]|nr:hypothetical protein [Gammaproteobacteria bacterium]